MKNLFFFVNLGIGVVAMMLGVVALFYSELGIAFVANGLLAVATAAGCLWLAKESFPRQPRA